MARKRVRKAKKARPQRVARIAAIAITQAGRDYLAELGGGLLQGAIGKVTVKSQALNLVEALHRVATGGTATVTSHGGSPGQLNKLLEEHLTQCNAINNKLGAIVLDS